MRVNVVKRALAAGEPVIGTWMNLTDSLSARLMCRAGWEYVTLDVEHTAVDWERASAIFAHIADAGCVPLCRVPDGTTENIKKALDAGAWGIMDKTNHKYKCASCLRARLACRAACLPGPHANPHTHTHARKTHAQNTHITSTRTHTHTRARPYTRKHAHAHTHAPTDPSANLPPAAADGPRILAHNMA
jgi:hypothetical protein